MPTRPPTLQTLLDAGRLLHHVDARNAHAARRAKTGEETQTDVHAAGPVRVGHGSRGEGGGPCGYPPRSPPCRQGAPR
eukprot:364995-Chlamydomonas_euryale.AAC.10